jgi:uncharacterized membrane protein
MQWNPDVTRLGWLVVAIILGWTGIQHMINMKIFGKVVMPGSAPLMEGAPVFVIGLFELALGVFCLYRSIRRS